MSVPADFDASSLTITQLEALASITIDLASDIYCPTLHDPDGGDDNFNFTTHPSYEEVGHVVATMNATSATRFPKVLVWDWNGDGDVFPEKMRFVVIRGTHSLEEWKGNFNCTEVNGTVHGVTSVVGRFHTDFLTSGMAVWNATRSYIEEFDGVVVIVGHSRGAALAQVVTVLARAELPSATIVGMAYAPPPPMALDDEFADLTSTIYSFVNSLDPIPRIFIHDFQKLICGNDECDHETDAITVLVKLFGGLASSVTYAGEGLEAMTSVVWAAMNQAYSYPDSIKITKHVGRLYQIYFGPFKMLDTGKTELYARSLAAAEVADISRLSKASPIKIGTSMSAHDPNEYRMAIQKPKCTNCEDLFSKDDYASRRRRQRGLLSCAQLPEWLPDPSGNDTTCSVGDNGAFECVANGTTCAGVAADANLSVIVSVTCAWSNKVCTFALDDPSGCDGNCTDVDAGSGWEDDHCTLGVGGGATIEPDSGLPAWAVVLIVLVVLVVIAGVIVTTCCCCQRKKGGEGDFKKAPDAGITKV